MSYILEILPSLLSGAATTLQVFALVLVFFDSFGNYAGFFDANSLEAPAMAASYLHLDYAWDAAFIAVNLYLLCFAKYRNSTGSDSGSDYCLYTKLCRLFCGDLPRRHFFHSDWTV